MARALIGPVSLSRKTNPKFQEFRLLLNINCCICTRRLYVFTLFLLCLLYLCLCMLCLSLFISHLSPALLHFASIYTSIRLSVLRRTFSLHSTIGRVFPIRFELAEIYAEDILYGKFILIEISM